MTTYVPVPDNAPITLTKYNSERPTHIKVSVDYNKGGMNYFTYKTDARGYYLYVNPVKRERSELGVTMETYGLFNGSGFKTCLKQVPRLNKKTLAQVEARVHAALDALIEAFLAGDREGLAAILDTLKMEN